ncbi:MAG: hypothetical protein KDA57_16690 [Planctomycetales bacterium]|nr:hypothetical protein [Planctomycetales bacterium]
MFASNSDASAASSSYDAQREWRLLRQLTLLVLVLSCAWAMALNLVDPDLWGHVRYAEDWLATGVLPRTASHTYSAAAHPWVNHENLAELCFALGYRYLGITGLLIAKCLAGLAILFAMVWNARKNGVKLLVAWTLMLLIAAALHPFFFLRPQLLSFALCSLMLVLLETGFCDWQNQKAVRWWPLLLLIPVFVIWANTHGAFVAGLGIATVYLLGRVIELIALRQSPDAKDCRKASIKVLLSLMAIILGICAATFVNPYGFELHRWLARSLSQPRPEITEWAAPRLGNPAFWPWVVLLSATGLSLLLTRQRRDWVRLVILVLVAWQSALHMRHIPFFALLCGFWMPNHYQSAIGKIQFRLPQVPWLRQVAVIALLACLANLSFSIDRRVSHLPVARNDYPLDAVQYMVDRGLRGKLVVSFNWAQYAVASLSPAVQVGFDGRFRTCYPQEVIDMHFDFQLGEFGGSRNRSPNSGPIDATRVLTFGEPDLVLLDRHYSSAVETMQDCSDWVLLFRDRVAEIWGRRLRYDDPHSADYLPLALRVQDPRPRTGSLQWPALPVRDQGARFAGQNVGNDEQPVEM